MNGKIAVLVLCAVLLVLSAIAEAQQPKKVARIGYIASTSAAIQKDVFRQALRDLGYIEGENIHFEYRYIEGQQDRAPGFVAELVELKVDVLVVSTLSTLRAAKQRPKLSRLS
jgi:putative ABC transport system substrate-binding protein